MNIRSKQRNVLLVGSVPLSDSSEVFRTVSEELGPLISRIPDGETGARRLWIACQIETLRATPNLRQLKVRESNGIQMPLFGIADDRQPVKFGALGYAHAAKSSYETFAALKKGGVIGQRTRFQVSLPTPLAITAGFIDGASQQSVEAALEQQMLQELSDICAAIPHDQLAIQWDVCHEVLVMAGWDKSEYFDKSPQHMLNKVARLGNAVPADVELGFHLCYGDPGHKHIVEPIDLALSVEIAGHLLANIQRPIQWIHMPVPRDRQEDDYFIPLKRLERTSSTEIFLGLVHLTDGFEGTCKRIAVAEKYIDEFGIATECGFGRRPKDTVVELLKLHKEVASKKEPPDRSRAHTG